MTPSKSSASAYVPLMYIRKKVPKNFARTISSSSKTKTHVVSTKTIYAAIATYHERTTIMSLEVAATTTVINASRIASTATIAALNSASKNRPSHFARHLASKSITVSFYFQKTGECGSNYKYS